VQCEENQTVTITSTLYHLDQRTAEQLWCNDWFQRHRWHWNY
jgi:hypothetical protein